MTFPQGRIFAAAFLISANLLGTGCGVGGPDMNNRVVVRDSAGIEIIESIRPQWTQSDAWQLFDKPVLEIGAAEGAAMALFHRVIGAAVLPNGDIVVANGGDDTVRLYDSAGRFLSARGGTGGGPGEFRGLSFIKLHGTTIFAGASGMVHSYDHEGVLLEQRRVSQRVPAGILDDGTLFLRRPGMWPSTRDGRWRERSSYFALRKGAEFADSLANLPDLTWETLADGEPSVVVFGAMGYHAVADAVLFHGWSEHFDIAVLASSGEVRRRIRRATPNVPVTANDRTAFIDAMINANAGHGPSAQQLRAALEGAPVAHVLPAYMHP